MKEELMDSQVLYLERDIYATMRVLVRQIELFGLRDGLNETYNSLTACLEDAGEQTEVRYAAKFRTPRE